jgi:hypothetical protein
MRASVTRASWQVGCLLLKNVRYYVRQADPLRFHAAILLTGHCGPNWKALKTLLGLLQPHVGTRLYGPLDLLVHQPVIKACHRKRDEGGSLPIPALPAPGCGWQCSMAYPLSGAQFLLPGP